MDLSPFILPSLIWLLGQDIQLCTFDIASQVTWTFDHRMRHPKLTVQFNDLQEVAMGSPYKIATLRIDGKWIPKLPETEWQDLHAQSESGRYHALVRWDGSDEFPAFRVVVLDVQKKIVVQSDPIEGCCTNLKWTGTGFSFQPFRYFSLKAIKTLCPIDIADAQ